MIVSGVAMIRPELLSPAQRLPTLFSKRYDASNDAMTLYTQSWLGAFRNYLAASATLHFVWEVLHLPLYTIWSTGSLRELAFAVVHCTAGDLMIASLSLLIALVLFGSAKWPSERFAVVLGATVAIGIGYTVYSEWMNTTVRKTWEYSTLMPTIPLFGTGLSPLMQWLVTPIVAFVAVRHRQFWPCVGSR